MAQPESTTGDQHTSNYELYQQAPFNHPNYFPIQQFNNHEWYRPMADWMGRLILPAPEQRSVVKGCLFEVYHTAAGYDHLLGQVVYLRWGDTPPLQRYLRAAVRDVQFNQKALDSIEQGLILGERLNGWKQVDPLESLAGARPHDDVVVRLPDPVTVELPDGVPAILRIPYEPIQISGRFYALVCFQGQVGHGSDQFRVVHYNRVSRQFDGDEEVVRMPAVIDDMNGISPSTTHAIEKSPVNATGWYIYGTQDDTGMFVVQSFAPRALLRLQPDTVICDEPAARRYLKKGCWADGSTLKGRVTSVVLDPSAPNRDTAMAAWQEGDQALLLHVYGGIGGKKREPIAMGGMHFGHFAYGIARVIHEPLADELSFAIHYHQVYTHNVDGLIAGTLDWSRYMGDRQWGWMGTRPVTDILVKLDAFTRDYDFGDRRQSGLGILRTTLETMTARYRIGDGTGATYVGPANNCSQDANQALYAAMRLIVDSVNEYPLLNDWMQQNPDDAERFRHLLDLGQAMKRTLLPVGSARADWRENRDGLNIDEGALYQLWLGLRSWRTVFPRVVAQAVSRLFLKEEAHIWVLRTVQVGGHDPDIEPITPLGF